VTPSLHVITASQRRGAEQAAVDLARALAAGQEPGARVVALAPGAQGNPLGVEILGTRTLGPGTLAALRRDARAAGAVVAHGSRTLPASVLALAGHRVPLVYRSIGDPRAWSGQGLRRWRVARLLARVDHVVAIWPGAAEALVALHGLDPDRISVIPSGVPAARCPVPDAGARREARRQLGLPATAPVVAAIGALSPEKGLEVAIEAVAKLDGAHLLVAGDGPQRASLETRAGEAAPGRVHFAGVLPGPGLALAAADAVVLTSRTEGLPGVLIEAGLAARPAVATDVGGVGEVVRHGETGILVEPGDAAGVTGALQRLLDGEPERSAMGQAARRHCLATFEIGVVAAAWAALLERLA
jgi:glycosyltransferase involved in cell wall biosynthesis